MPRHCHRPALAVLGLRSQLFEKQLAYERAEALALYLADLHREEVEPARSRRALRDLVGHGEGIMGLTDSYAPDDPIATPERLRALEHRIVDWRWRLRELARARRTHGDFHPFNLLFREGTDFSVLDASRGGAGDPADDVACLSINYLFFALTTSGTFGGALRQVLRVWSVFLGYYAGVPPQRLARWYYGTGSGPKTSAFDPNSEE